MSPSGRYRGNKRILYFGPELDSALVDFVEKTGEKMSDIVRRAVAKEIGRPELAGSVRMGRPPKPDEAPSPPVKKPARKEAAKTAAVKKARKAK